MTNELRTGGDYEFFVYSLPERFPAIQGSTLRFVRLGASLARVEGELHFRGSVPAPELRFDRANLPFLTWEIELVLETSSG